MQQTDQAYPVYEVQVFAEGGEWKGEGVKFATVEGAREYAHNLAWRTTRSHRWRVVDQRGNVAAESNV